MDNNKFFYWAFTGVILIEVLNLVFKVFNPYYFNLGMLTALTVLSAWLGRRLGIKTGWIVTLTIFTLLLIVLLTFVVWN